MLSRDALWRDAARDLWVGLVLLIAVAIAGLSVSGAVLAVTLYLAIAGTVAIGLESHRPHATFGPANRITLVRAVATCALAGILVGGEPGERAMWLVTAAAALSLALDGVDGWVARRSRLASRFGARFDMEIDALLILVLCAILWRADKTGAWVMLAGLLRYAFVAAGRAWPWLLAPLPPSERRRVICAVMVGALVVACAPVLAPVTASAVAGLGLALTVYSFAVDIAWLHRHAPVVMQS